MINYNLGDVVLVPFPFTNQQVSKKRPAVVISRNIYQQTKADILLMAITSQVRTPLALGECLLNDWQHAGLLKLSQIKPIIVTLESRLILKKLGHLSDADQRQMQLVLNAILPV